MPDLPYHHDWKPRFETSFGLRVKWFGRWGGDPDWCIEPSRLASDLICFFYLEAGSCTATVNGARIPMRPGDLVVLRGGDVFSFTQDRKHPQISLSACLSLDRDDNANALLRQSFNRHYSLKDKVTFESHFNAVRDALDGKGRRYDYHITAAIFRWLGGLLDELDPKLGAVEGDSKTVQRVLAAQEWMRQRLGEQVTIREWVDVCGLNADYFSRLFKAHTGMSPKAWLSEARLQRAIRLLAEAGTTIEEIAGYCGYNCPFHFSRTFKRRFGVPPARYRNVRQVHGLIHE